MRSVWQLQQSGLILLGFLVIGGGCRPSNVPENHTVAPASPGVEGAPLAGPETEGDDTITLVETDADGLRQAIAAHHGKIVVVDMWATWCPPCVKEFPGLIALQNDFGTEQLACISMSCDFQGLDEFSQVRAHVLKFLRGRNATIENYIATSEADDFFAAWDVASVPVIEVYASDGSRVRRFDAAAGDKFTYIEVRDVVESLLEP